MVSNVGFCSEFSNYIRNGLSSSLLLGPPGEVEVGRRSDGLSSFPPGAEGRDSSLAQRKGEAETKMKLHTSLWEIMFIDFTPIVLG